MGRLEVKAWMKRRNPPVVAMKIAAALSRAPQRPLGNHRRSLTDQGIIEWRPELGGSASLHTAHAALRGAASRARAHFGRALGAGGCAHGENRQQSFHVRAGALFTHDVTC